jgi:hypothetical protein
MTRVLYNNWLIKYKNHYNNITYKHIKVVDIQIINHKLKQGVLTIKAIDLDENKIVCKKLTASNILEWKTPTEDIPERSD